MMKAGDAQLCARLAQALCDGTVLDTPRWAPSSNASGGGVGDDVDAQRPSPLGDCRDRELVLEFALRQHFGATALSAVRIALHLNYDH